MIIIIYSIVLVQVLKIEQSMLVSLHHVKVFLCSHRLENNETSRVRNESQMRDESRSASVAGLDVSVGAAPLADALAACQAKLKEKESAYQKLDAELDDLVKYYKSIESNLIARIGTMPIKLVKLEEDLDTCKKDIKKKEDDIARFQQNQKLLQRENEDLQSSLLESMSKLQRLDQCNPVLSFIAFHGKLL